MNSPARLASWRAFEKKEERKAYVREWTKSPKRRAWLKAWREKNRQKILAWRVKWNKEHRPILRKLHKQWRTKNPIKLAGQNSRRRERKLSVPSCSSQEINVISQLVSAAEKMDCAICGQNMPKTDRTIDHVIPLAKGGSGEAWNLQIVHRSCNCKKNAKLPQDFDGQFQMNFAGNRAYLTNSRTDSGDVLGVLKSAKQTTVNF